MRAVVIEEPGRVGVTELPDPVPAADEVVVAVHAAGICGTDVHILDGEFSLASYPVVPGHEFAGEVVAAGRDVTGLSVGDRVTADPNIYCGRCRPCRQGHGNLCQDFRALGINLPGACAELVAVPAYLAQVLPRGLDMAIGALVEPLSCAVHGYDVIAPRLADRFLVYGAGTMGLLLVALAPRVGAVSVDVVEPRAARRELALHLGATRVVGSGQDLGDARYEVVIDATGSIEAIEDALSRVARGGTFHQFGVAPAAATAAFSPYRLYSDEARYHGSIAVLHSFERACELAANLDLGLGHLVSDVLPLASYTEAVERVRRGTGVKVQVAPVAAAPAPGAPAGGR